jgi:hypothetical protein
VSDGFEKLKQQVEQDCRFRVLISRLEMGGYCAVCRATQDGSANAGSARDRSSKDGAVKPD